MKEGDTVLTALKEDGQVICLADFQNVSSLKTLREKENFYCPGCEEKMILKIGTKKITHFAHYKGSSCVDQCENETEYHLEGKKKLYLWLKKKGIEPELEFFDKEIRQRPDIRFTFQNRRYALEYQCSVIPEAVFIKRTRCYLEHHYIPIWILGGEFFSRKSTSIVNLSDFQYLCINSSNSHSNLAYYCPTSNQFIFVQQIFPFTVRNALASFNIGPLENLNLQDITNPQPILPPTIEAWHKEITRFKQYYSQKPKGYRDPFLKELYLNQIHLAYLPPEVGLPLANSIFIRTPPAIWQGYLFLDCFHRRMCGDRISYYTIEQAFEKRVWKKQIIVRELPLLVGDATHAVREYLCVLKDCGFLTEISPNIFQVNRKLIAASNMVEQLEKEKEFYSSNKSSLHFLR